MSKKIPQYLKLHVEDAADGAASARSEFADLCGAFQEATGWTLELDFRSAERQAEPDDGTSETAGACSFRLESVGDSGSRLERSKTQRLAASLAHLLSELDRARDAVWRREADLAAGVPVTSQGHEEQHLAARLEAVLKGGAQAVGCQAAGVYLLDDATTELKLRATWGLSRQRLLAPPRPLRGAVADLEALVGHAVVLENTQLLPQWKVPEPCAAAICVPISSPTEPLGTLWMFSNAERGFSAEQANLVEIIAGRVASELQREMLLRECVQTKRTERQLSLAVQWQNDRLPSIRPLLPDWDVAGWLGQHDALRGGFYDWFVPPGGELALALGNADGMELEAALTAASLHGAIRSEANRSQSAGQMFESLNEAMWNSSAGGQTASFFCALIRPETGEMECLVAGQLTAVILGNDGFVRVPGSAEPLGSLSGCATPAFRHQLRRGDTLVVLAGAGGKGKQASAASLAIIDRLNGQRFGDAQSLLSCLADIVEKDESVRSNSSPVALVVQRKTS